MTASPQPPDAEPTTGQPRDAAYWAQAAAGVFRVDGSPPGAPRGNVVGRRAVGPLQGFGPLWQKTYRVRLAGSAVTPAELIATWKARFADFWPAGNRFYAPLRGLAPGEVALLSLGLPGHVRLSTGVLVLYADEESFTLMTPQGHMLSGWITFSAYRGDDGGDTVEQAEVLMRADDPLYELGLRLGGHRHEDAFWRQTLGALAAAVGVAAAPVEVNVVCLDRRLQWAQAGNLRYNAALRSAISGLTSPLHRLRALVTPGEVGR